ncbi:DUF4189 domain-containing protein [Pseudomonas sp. CGJS7]|uniref:DUF4189 domain-containing protein n=1 Tax=Pseudomonas sp. CGJS7 TaxID=3109348 RepID=UPI003FA6BBCA
MYFAIKERSGLAFLTGTLWAGLFGTASAEGGCPAGMIPYQGISTMSCGPMPSDGYGTAASGPIWASRWGAIARDKAVGIMSAVDSRDSKRRARADAIADCKSRGGGKCKVILTYRTSAWRRSMAARAQSTSAWGMPQALYSSE